MNLVGEGDCKTRTNCFYEYRMNWKSEKEKKIKGRSRKVGGSMLNWIGLKEGRLI